MANFVVKLSFGEFGDCLHQVYTGFLRNIFDVSSERPQDQVVEGSEADVVPHHEEEGLRDLADGLDDEADYIVKVTGVDEKVRFTYFLPTAISPGWRSALFSLAKSSSAGAMS